MMHRDVPRHTMCWGPNGEERQLAQIAKALLAILQRANIVLWVSENFRKQNYIIKRALDQEPTIHGIC